MNIDIAEPYTMLSEMVLASDNQGKIAEINAIMKKLPIKLRPQSEFNIPAIKETGTTFVENAIIKARHAAKFTGLPTISDDSGLVVNALNGAPGVYSARYAGVGASNQDRINKLLKELEKSGDEDRSASFYCVMVFMVDEKDPAPIIFQGIWEGEILHKPSGTNGFGYDPIFFVPEYGCSAADLNEDIKNKISHRAQALEDLCDVLKEFS